MSTYDKQIYEHLGKRLRQLRKAKGYSLAYVAERLGKTKKTVQRYEMGMHRMEVSTIRQLADLYEISYNELMQGVQQEMNTPQILGDHQNNIDFLADKPELLSLYQEICEKETLALLFDSAKDLEPSDLEMVLTIIRGIRKERGID